MSRLDSEVLARVIGAWLATTARHESLRVLRIAARQGPARDDDFLDLVPADDIGVDSAILTEVRDRELWELITDLPLRCQLLLQFLTGETRSATSRSARR